MAVPKGVVSMRNVVMRLRASHSGGKASPSHRIMTLASEEDILRKKYISTPKRCSRPCGDEKLGRQ